jgi:hypothetical protein
LANAIDALFWREVAWVEKSLWGNSCRARRRSIKLIVTAPQDLMSVWKRRSSMLQQIFDTFVMLIPVFFLLTMIFGAGFYIGRVSKKDS